jgi:hypothetical protein
MRKEAKPFVPSSSVVSREGIAVKAYLNSPDAETLAQVCVCVCDVTIFQTQALALSPE